MMMFERIRYYLKPPTFPDEEQNRIANLLQISLFTLIIGTIIGLLNCLLFGYFQTSLALTIGLVGVVGSFLLLRYHHLTAASWTMLLTLIVTLMLIVLIGEGSHDIAILLFPVVIMVAGLLLDKRSLLVFTLIVILSLQGIILGEVTGIIVNKMSEFTLVADLVTVVVILFISAVAIFLLSDSIRRTFRRALLNAQSIKESNLKLKSEIEERNRMEGSLRESEKKYRTLAETMTDALFTLDLKGNFTYINPTFERTTGYRVRDFLGLSFIKIIAPEYVRPTVEMFKQGISGKRTPLYQIELICKNGERLPIELNMSTILDAKGQAIGRLGIARDITERKKAEDALRESEERIRAILDASPDVIHLLDINGIILSSNEGYVKRLGLKIDDVVGKCIFDLTPQGSIHRRKAAIEKVFRTGEPLQLEDNAAIGVFESHVQPIFNPAGEVTAVAVYASDITERKQAEEDLREHINRLERFNKVTVGRELRMTKMKEEVNSLLKELGREPKYSSNKDREKEGDQ